jgi:alpha-tubulin suppressor-like RCC1 family protein
MQTLPLTCDTSNAQIAAGASCNLIQTSNGHVYYNGKHRSVGEATMRPILIEQLATNQHVISACASGFQSVVCATDIGNTVAWGQGPYGELGLKEQKSSSKPAFVEALSGIPIMHVACGYGHTLFVAHDDEKAAKEAIKQLPVVKHDDVEALMK